MKVGDRVKAVSESCGWGGVKVGDIGTITTINGNSLVIDFPAHHSWAGRTENVELLPSGEYVDWNHPSLEGRLYVALDGDEGALARKVVSYWERPTRYLGCWQGPGGYKAVPDDAIIGPLPPWDQSLRKRPEEKPFKENPIVQDTFQQYVHCDVSTCGTPRTGVSYPLTEERQRARAARLSRI
jgi:hypothetical protein